MLIYLENYRIEVDRPYCRDFFTNRFVHEEFSFPNALQGRLSSEEFNDVVNDLNEIVLYTLHKERSIVCERFNRSCFGLVFTLIGVIIALTSLSTVGVNKSGIGFLVLWASVCFGMVLSIIGLAIIVFPDTPKKWKEKALLWASLENEKFGDRGIVFSVDIDNLENIPSIPIEIKKMPPKIYEFLSGQLICSIPSFIPPKVTEQESIP